VFQTGHKVSGSESASVLRSSVQNTWRACGMKY